MPGRGEGKGDQRADRDRQHDPGRADESHHPHRDHERDRVDHPAADRREDLTDGNVGSGHRCGQHRVVQLRVTQLLEHVARRIEDRPVHRRGRQEGRGHELRVVVGDAVDDDVANERGEPDLHRQQVEQRLEEARHQDHPGVAIEHHAAFHHPLGSLRLGEHLDRHDAQRDGHGANRRANVTRQANQPAMM